MSFLSSNPLFVIPVIAVFLLAVGTALWLWWSKRRAEKQSQPGGKDTAAAPAPGDPTEAIFREAENRLKLSPRMKGVALSSLPAFFLIGPEKAGRTNLVLHSGLDPELLA